MSLKAGRVGVNPADVDPVDGHIKSDATSGYTKQEADAKFETQLHAASTYETKSDAAVLQPKTLAVPIEMLSGSKLTVESALQGLNSEKMSYADNGVLGAKNPLQFPYEAGMSKEQNGITFTVNPDGSVTVSGIATGLAGFKLFSTNTFRHPFTGKRVKMTGCPSGGSDATYYISGYRMATKNGSGGTVYDIGSGVEFDLLNDGSGTVGDISITVLSGTDLTTPIIFYPMIRLASDSDSTYQPYAMTNRELTKKVEVNTGDITSPHANISLDATHKYANKQGNTGFFRVRFTVNTALSSGTASVLFKLPYPSQYITFIPVFDRNAPWAVKDFSAYIDNDDVIVNANVPTGSYDICGTYLCK